MDKVALIIKKLKDKGVKIYLKGEDLELSFLKDDLSNDEEFLYLIKNNKNLIKGYLKSSSFKKKETKIEKTKYKVSYPLSFSQYRLWILSQFEGGSEVYNLPKKVYLRGGYNIASFKRAVFSVIDRHEILRTIFKKDNKGEVRQWILDKDTIALKIHEVDFRDDPYIESSVSKYMADDSRKAFDLETGPLLRASLLRISEEDYVFYYNMHHIISDGWSIEVLSRDVFTYYNCHKAGEEFKLPPLRIQYKDYATWQLSQLKKSDYQAHRDYWINQLRGELPVFSLPSTNIRPPFRTYRGGNISTYLSSDLTRNIRMFSQKHGGTLFMVLLSSLKALLHRYTGQNDLLVGTPVAGRDNADLEDQIGFYVNTLVLRNEVYSEDSFMELFDRVRVNTLDGYTHQTYPFDKLVDDLDLVRDMSRNALFDIMIVLQNASNVTNVIKKSRDTDQILVIEDDTLSKFDLSFIFKEQGDYLSLVIEYNRDVYTDNMIVMFVNHYKQIMSRMLSSPEIKVGNVDYLSLKESHNLLEVFNDTKVELLDSTLVALFESQVEKTPNNTALVFGSKVITYKELSAVSNQFSNYLLSNYSISTDSIVSIKLKRSDWFIVCALGVMKSGGAYVPIDINYPKNRINFIESDSNCEVSIDTDFLAHFIETKDEYSSSPIENILIGSNDLAYVIYTSGSMGLPKGVMIEHGGVVNTILSVISGMKIKETYKGLQFSSFSFDASIWESFIMLISGAELHIIGDEERKNSKKLGKYILDNRIDVVTLPPSVLNLLDSFYLSSLKVMITAGESPKAHIIKKIVSNVGCSYYNAYGPTESSICASTYFLDKQKNEEDLTIGSPISNTEIYILNEDLELQPIGVVGEICISGFGLARGYLNRPDLTREKFVPHPFKAGERLYRTGDLGKWLADGNISFLGRADDQVKIRGYRIELGEIEHVLQGYSAIDEVVVQVFDDVESKSLVAYFISNISETVENLRRYLSSHIPDYMIPSYFVQLESFPLTPNGKLDRKSLPDPLSGGILSGVSYVEARTVLERELVEVWQEVLKREGIGVKDNFYGLGGDSIKSIQVVSRLKQRGYSTKVEHILRNPILEDLAILLDVDIKSIDQSIVTGSVNLTPIQSSFLYDSSKKVKGHYNQSVLLFSASNLNIGYLRSSLDTLLKHHDGLRLSYNKEGDSWFQNNSFLEAGLYSLEEFDLRLSKDERYELGLISEDLQGNTFVDKGPLLRLGLFRCSDGDRLLIIIHHLLIDGISWRILLEDLLSLYSNYASGSSTILPQKTDSFQSWSNSLSKYSSSKVLLKECSYWDIFKTLSVNVFPVDTIDVSEVVDEYATVSLDLGEDLTNLLQTRFHSVYNTDFNDLLLTSLGLSLRDVLGISRSIVEMEGHGREDIGIDIDISRTIGWFTTVFPFLLEVSEEERDSILDLIEIKDNFRRLPNKGIGYGVLKHLTGIYPEDIVANICFNYLGDFGGSLSSSDSSHESLFSYSDWYKGKDISLSNASRDVSFSISGMILSGSLGLSITYNRKDYRSRTMNELINSYKAHLINLIKNVSDKESSYLTSGDLTFKGLSSSEFLSLNMDGDIEDVYGLSPLQEGIYYHWLSDPSSTMYFEQMSYRLEGSVLDVELLRKSYDLLVSRHSILRTSFSTDYSGESLQIVRKSVASTFKSEVVSDFDTPEDLDSYLHAYRERDRAEGFDLNSGSQMRLIVLELGAGSYEFIWSHHHILTDGWCMSILVNDFNEFLDSLERDRSSRLKPVVPYSRYIDWLSGIDKSSSLSYWRDYLSGYSDRSLLPFEQNLNKDKIYEQGKEYLQISGDLLRSMRSLCHRLEITENTFIQSIWGYLLSRYNNTNDAVFGSIVSGRSNDVLGIEDMVGLFSNTIPVRIKYDDSMSAEDLLLLMQEESISSLPHHYLNLSEVQAQSELGMNLMDHVLVFENYAIQESSYDYDSSKGFNLVSREVYERTNYDFGGQVISEQNDIYIKLVYNKAKYKKEDLLRFISHFLSIVKTFTYNSEKPLKSINYLLPEEKYELTKVFNNTKVDYPFDKTVIDLFEAQVEKNPDSIAVVFENEELTYRELNERSNQLANYLKVNIGVKKSDRIGVLLRRSLDSVVGMISIMKLGCSYLPFNDEFPMKRISYMLKDSGVDILLIQQSLIQNYEFESLRLVIIDSIDLSVYSLFNPVVIGREELEASIMYTSGSTGNPKGIIQTHKMLMNLINWDLNHSNISIGLRHLLYSSFSFDLIFQDIYFALSGGGRIYITSEEERLDFEMLRELILSQQIEVLSFPFSALNTFISYIDDENFLGHKVRYITSTGEQLYVSPKLESFIKSNNEIVLYNYYGPSETHIVTSYIMSAQIKNIEYQSSIGSPISNTEIYILNEDLELQPIGVVGEICISGSGLARGYLNRPDLTREKFVPHPFKAGERLYRTGDLGKWLADGNISFLGRADDQVKIRGYRIELGEIEHVLQGYSAIDEVVVQVFDDVESKSLVAYFISNISETVENLRRYLSSHIPDYMIPSYFVQLESFPLTPNGKLDRKSLPDPLSGGISSGVSYVEPRNDLEKRLVKIWQDLLHKDKISIEDDFFLLGGHSLKVTRLLSMIYKEFKVKLALKDLFTDSVLRSQAILITDSVEMSYEVIPVLSTEEDYALSSSQQRLWLVDKVGINKGAYTMYGSKELGAELDVSLFEDSIRDLLARHEVFTNSFYRKGRSSTSKSFTHRRY